MHVSIERMHLSLDGLSVGDAFGELFFTALKPVRRPLAALPPGPWPWTDDTAMAVSIVEVLEESGHIDQDRLARLFGERYRADPDRDYGSGACELLYRIGAGESWRDVSPTLFRGGSWGNGAAMRAAPIGAYFGDPGRAAAEAQRASIVTHFHPEGQAGGMAVAAAAAIASLAERPAGERFLREAIRYVPPGKTRDRIEAAAGIAPDRLDEAITTLGTGIEVAAFDTAPFCLWVAAWRLEDFEGALWTTALGLGDVDTTCAIVGGIVAVSCGAVPPGWIGRREPLPPRGRKA